MADDDLADRYGERLDDTREENDVNEKNATNEENEKSVQNEMAVTNIKEEWDANSIYLPDFLYTDLRTTYKRTDLEYETEFGESLQKTRYYYPLVIQLGLERIEGMEADEIKERVEALGRED